MLRYAVILADMLSDIEIETAEMTGATQATEQRLIWEEALMCQTGMMQQDMAESMLAIDIAIETNIVTAGPNI